ncbi:thymidylate kinase [Anaplasma centrale str. Israel]|uniref:Thymidylate kinase n=1 Tax=Anaplasma centrale (strain Israel) TaxID=574556 RepID=D1AT17_ANACI|nr:dTMP kinase [Anaplasma centrale]ACZ49620.1 thymidylate kinase [Anaplasma centrale str. Israel]
MFITFEGVDGCGKTTQAALLAKYLSDLYGEHRVVLTREPGGTSFNELVREVLLGLTDYKMDRITELMLFMAMRRESFVKVVSPGLLAGKVVISDRFTDSTVAYQGYGCGVDLSLVNMLNSLVADVVPDITFVMDISTELALTRTTLNGCESRSPEFYDKVREGFRAIVASNPHRCHMVNCAEDSVEDVYSVHDRIVALFHEVTKDKLEIAK